MRVVVDTTVAVSGLLWDGPSNEILKWVRDGFLMLLVCQDTLKELARILRYKRFQPRLRMVGMSADEVIAHFMNRVRFVPNPTEVPRIIHEEPFDNLFLAVAVEGKAQLIISGDQHLLALESHRGMQIVTPHEACAVIETLERANGTPVRK